MTEVDSIGTLGKYLRPRAHDIFVRADQHSKKLIADARQAINEFLIEKQFDLDSICIVCVGSVGRNEALDCSDIDLIPILADESALGRFAPLDQELRRRVRDKLAVPVSKGEDLTKATTVQELTDPDAIGGSKDDTGALTKRILIMTESKEVAGNFKLPHIRRAILNCYSNPERTSGRHVLALCNDVARYYRTLCIEYKAKVDVEEKDWCTRNMKLRHSRKLWYFSNIISISHLADENPIQRESFADALCSLFDIPPSARLLRALSSSHPIEIGNLFEHFSYFMDFMSRDNNRKALAAVDHSNRYEASMNNPFPAVKFNSDALHNCMMSILNGLDPSRRKVVFDWFLM